MYNYNLYFDNSNLEHYLMQEHIAFAFLVNWTEDLHSHVETSDIDEVMCFSL